MIPTYLEAVKARNAKPDVAVIERWDRVTGAHDVYIPDIERMSQDLATLIRVVELQQEALKHLKECYFSMVDFADHYEAEEYEKDIAKLTLILDAADKLVSNVGA